MKKKALRHTRNWRAYNNAKGNSFVDYSPKKLLTRETVEWGQEVEDLGYMIDIPKKGERGES